MTKIYRNSGTHLFFLLWKASRQVMKFSHLGITRAGFKSLSDFAVLECLLHQGPQPVSAIGAHVMLTSGSITTAVQRLQKKGWLRRQRTEKDVRVVMVDLTDKGRTMIEQSFAEHALELDQLFEVFDEAERAQFTRLIGKLGHYAGDLND